MNYRFWWMDLHPKSPEDKWGWATSTLQSSASSFHTLPTVLLSRRHGTMLTLMDSGRRPCGRGKLKPRRRYGYIWISFTQITISFDIYYTYQWYTSIEICINHVLYLFFSVLNSVTLTASSCAGQSVLAMLWGQALSSE